MLTKNQVQGIVPTKHLSAGRVRIKSQSKEQCNQGFLQSKLLVEKNWRILGNILSSVHLAQGGDIQKNSNPRQKKERVQFIGEIKLGGKIPRWGKRGGESIYNNGMLVRICQR